MCKKREGVALLTKEAEKGRHVRRGIVPPVNQASFALFI